MRINSILTISIITLVATACTNQTTSPELPHQSQEFSALLDQYYEDGLKLYPLNATRAGDHRYNDQLPNDLDEEVINSKKKHYAHYLAEASKYDPEYLSKEDQLSRAILEWECELRLAGFDFKIPEYLPVRQLGSLNLTIGQFASGQSAQPFKTVKDYEDWLKRLDGYLEWMTSAEANMKEGMGKGYVLPRSLIVKVIPQLEAMTTEDLDNHLFYQPVKVLPETFTPQEKEEITKAYSSFISEQLIPAYQSLLQFMNEEYLDAGRETSGIDDLPNGKEYYQYMIKWNTTTELTADEIHQLGLSEGARIRTEMEKIKQQLGFQGELKEFFEHVRNNQELMPYNDPQQVIDNFNVIYDRMKPQVDRLFDIIPKTAFEVRRVEAFREKSSPAHYNAGSLDGTRPGIFYVPIPDVTRYNTFRDESLFLHEAIPGHHFQISLARENIDLPKFRKTLLNSAHAEGWALYCESLGKELGLYTDPYQHFGMLSLEMHRAIRLVVDTGLHSKGWTREKAITYLLDNEALSEAGITSEIERYMAWPGQALSYKIGQLKIQELRTKAEEILQDKFDIRQFHNQILMMGPVPLTILETEIHHWIETASSPN